MRTLAPAFLLLLAGCAQGPRLPDKASYARGYEAGRADEIKSLYWVRQALQSPGGRGPAGRTEYYTWTDDGGGSPRLAPEEVAVPVFIPAPVP